MRWSRWVLIKSDWCPYEKRRLRHTERGARGVLPQMKGHVRTVRRQLATCKSGREASREGKPANTLILYFQPPELQEN